MKNAKKLLALILALCMVLSMAACGSGNSSGGGKSDAPAETGAPAASGSEETPAAQGGESTYNRQTAAGTFTIAYDEEPATLEVTQVKLIAGWTITGAIYDQIIARDSETGEYYGVLAESFEYLDDYTLEIKLRDNVYFSNGVKATSDDILFTLERLSVSSRFASNYACIDFEKTNCPDELTIDIVFKDISAPFMSYFSHPAASLESRAYFEEVGEDGYARNPVGTGPYTFVSWTSGDSVVLARNENYWGDAPACETITVRFITENTTRMIEYETGGVDAIYNLSGDDIDRLATGGVENTNLYTLEGQNVAVVEMYKGYEPFQDQNVRMAIAHAIDWEAVVGAVYGSSGEIADSILPPSCLYYKSVGIYSYDPDLSKELLAEAGYGEEGSLVLTTYTQSGTDEQVCEIMQSYLQAVGVTMNISIVDTATMIGYQVSGECNFGLSNVTVTAGDPDQAISSSRLTSDYGIAVITGFDELQALYDAGAATIDANERQSIYEQVQQMYYDGCIRIPLRINVVSFAVRDYVTTFEPAASGILSLADIVA